MPVWVTRSAPDNLATARRLRDIGHGALLIPLVRTVQRSHEPIGRADAMLFTSVHAVRHHRRLDHKLETPIFVASDQVASAAIAAGYRNVTSTAGNDDILRDLMARTLPRSSTIVECCSSRTSNTMRAHLASLGFDVDRRAVYEPVAAEADMLDQAAERIRATSAIVVHSRTGAEGLRPIIERSGWRGTIWSISGSSAAALADLPGVNTACPAVPTEQALMQLVASHASSRARRSSRRPALPELVARRQAWSANDNDRH